MRDDDRVRLRHMNEARMAHGDVPWPAMAAMRNRLIHGDFDIDTGIVWRTAAEEVPGLLPVLQRILARP